MPERTKQIHYPHAITLWLAFAAGLVTFSLQVLLFRLLELNTGSSALAFSVTLSLYMLCMSLGAAWFDKVDLLSSHLGITQLAIIHAIQALAAAALGGLFLWGQSLPLVAVFGGAAALAAGAIFPGLAALLPPAKRSSQGPMLYGINIAGGSLGLAVTALAGIELLGLVKCLMATAFLSSFLALAFYFRSTPGDPGLQERNNNIKGQEPAPFLMVLGFLLGFTGLGLEMAVFRALTPVTGLSIYSLAGTLVPFLLGLGLGGILASRWPKQAEQLLPPVAFAAAVVLSLLLFTLDLVPATLVWLSAHLAPDGISWMAMLAATFIIAAIILVPGAILAGMLFPMLMTVALERDPGNRTVSAIYSINVLGSILGPLAVNLLLIDLLGVYWSFRLLLTLYLAIGTAFFLRYRPRRPKTAFFGTSALASVLLVLFIPAPDDLNVHSGAYWASHLYKETLSGPVRKLVRQNGSGKKVLTRLDGPVASVLVVQEGADRSLVIDGKPASHTRLDQPTQVMLAQLPLEMHSEAKKVLVIGWGSGQTVNEVLKYPVDEVVCVEISREVLEAASWFSSVNSRALTDPRLEIVVDDARGYLRSTDEKFDLIISQPSNPWVGFSGSLFTTEFLELCKEALTPDGVMTQWFQYYGADNTDMDIFLRTFGSAFPVWKFWSPSSGDLVLTGQAGGGYELEPAREPLATSEHTHIKTGRINTDNQPLLSYSMARNIFSPEPLDLDTYLRQRRIE
jgi:spermidine synthase